MDNIKERIRKYLQEERSLLERIVHCEEKHSGDYITSEKDIKVLKDIVRKCYEENAEHHDAFVVSNTPIELLIGLAKYLEREKDIKIVIDAGCGSGYHICGLAKLFPDRKFIGYDFALNGLKIGRERALRNGLENVSFLCADNDAIPIRKADMVCVINSIVNEGDYYDDSDPEYTVDKLMPELKNILGRRTRNFVSILRKNGTLALTSTIPSLMYHPSYSYHDKKQLKKELKKSLKDSCKRDIKKLPENSLSPQQAGGVFPANFLFAERKPAISNLNF